MQAKQTVSYQAASDRGNQTKAAGLDFARTYLNTLFSASLPKNRVQPYNGFLSSGNTLFERYGNVMKNVGFRPPTMLREEYAPGSPKEKRQKAGYRSRVAQPIPDQPNRYLIATQPSVSAPREAYSNYENTQRYETSQQKRRRREKRRKSIQNDVAISAEDLLEELQNPKNYDTQSSTYDQTVDLTFIRAYGRNTVSYQLPSKQRHRVSRETSDLSNIITPSFGDSIDSFAA